MQEFFVKPEEYAVYLRGGSILAVRGSRRLSLRREQWRPISLEILLDSQQKATGRLFMDDG